MISILTLGCRFDYHNCHITSATQFKSTSLPMWLRQGWEGTLQEVSSELVNVYSFALGKTFLVPIGHLRLEISAATGVRLTIAMKKEMERIQLYICAVKLAFKHSLPSSFMPRIHPISSTRSWWMVAWSRPALTGLPALPYPWPPGIWQMEHYNMKLLDS